MMKILVVFLLPTTFPGTKSLHFSASPTLRVLASFPLPSTLPTAAPPGPPHAEPQSLGLCVSRRTPQRLPLPLCLCWGHLTLSK